MKTQNFLLTLAAFTVIMFSATSQTFAQVGGAGGTREAYTTELPKKITYFKPSDLLIPVVAEEKTNTAKVRKNNSPARKRRKS